MSDLRGLIMSRLI